MPGMLMKLDEVRHCQATGMKSRSADGSLQLQQWLFMRVVKTNSGYLSIFPNALSPFSLTGVNRERWYALHGSPVQSRAAKNGFLHGFIKSVDNTQFYLSCKFQQNKWILL